MLNGHIFFVGREYEGPYSRILRRNTGNVPAPTDRDLKQNWLYAVKQFPIKRTEREWMNILHTCKKAGYRDALYYTKDVYSLRKIMNGLVVGPLVVTCVTFVTSVT